MRMQSNKNYYPMKRKTIKFSIGLQNYYMNEKQGRCIYNNMPSVQREKLYTIYNRLSVKERLKRLQRKIKQLKTNRKRMEFKSRCRTYQTLTKFGPNRV